MPLLRITICLLSLFAALLASANQQGYTVSQVRQDELVANLFLPATAAELPVVIAVGGSRPGLDSSNRVGDMLAPQGIAVLALAYFGEPGLPESLDNIPLEYFVQAIDFLQQQPQLQANSVGIYGRSRGAELALLLSSHDARISSVVALAPSNVAWNGTRSAASAWTINDKPVPSLTVGLDSSYPALARFAAALADEVAVKQARFALEKINGPLLLISATKDKVWPSHLMALDIQHYLQQKGFQHKVSHHSYPTGHGFSQAVMPEIEQRVLQHFQTTLR
ncbi:acyl-CoA thioester hydrolase/BAAT C-terminal domain-containing protein [Arsukibacterium perlucidum]|uniref:acyl-CoA thioester hydrolase/BAAT C-terminal domain-containing protein n=1 Tax=Arsukibacterium perlucidum TaxID=368811 RepID=UPI00036D400D|nr:acyl-CoA thioester hydrolase/BAAT C-terminal domain-containing protein [Arsukibacterium perlucidum]